MRLATNHLKFAYSWQPTRCKFGCHPGEMLLLAGCQPISIYHSVDRQPDTNFAEISG
jgi:hypothetical protein